MYDMLGSEFLLPGVFATVPLKDYLFRDLDGGHFWMVAARVSLPWRPWKFPKQMDVFMGKVWENWGKPATVIDSQRITINYSKIIEFVLLRSVNYDENSSKYVQNRLVVSSLMPVLFHPTEDDEIHD